DLSDVMFITTANTLKGIPVPLQDRMEIIELGGYTEFEKLHIAQRYLLPRQMKDCGLERVTLNLTEGAIRTVVHHYTKEAGVRSLEREIANICRKIARRVVKEGHDKRFDILAKTVPSFLGVPKHRLSKAEDGDEIGLTNGLAVWMYGGDLLPCEVAVLVGKGKLLITGLLEKGMEESAQAAMSYVRSRAKAFGLDADFYQKLDVHVHFPEFVHKDGPSAGVTMATSLVSALLQVPVRRDLAMTGELTLRGRVMPIGGLKEKLLAAHRAGIGTVVIPKENRKDLKEIPRRVLRSTRIVLAAHMDDVLREALRLSNPAAIFGPARDLMEYRNGELIIRNDEPAPPASSDELAPARAAEA
ncbi:MAG: endopeptidase La, partial [Polyangiaceae bacterium]|nr:endopeptidase La [Polyangiaceae bacterium]